MTDLIKEERRYGDLKFKRLSNYVFIVVVIITLASEGVGGLLSRCEGLFQPVTYAACRYYRHAGYAGYSWSNH